MSKLPYVNQSIKDEHIKEANAKRVGMYGWDIDNLEWVRMGVSSDGYQKMVLVAEDINNPGSFVTVQGQYNSNGNFELLTAGSGGTTTTPSNFLLETGDNLLLETGDILLLQ